jgi:hypothetical protein
MWQKDSAILAQGARRRSIQAPGGAKPGCNFARPAGFCSHRSFMGINMHKFIIASFIAAPLAALPGVGTAKGRLKGAAVGGVVGHVAGHHAVAGAAAGCIIEHHREKVRDKAAARQQNAPQDAAGAGGTATTPPRQ